MHFSIPDTQELEDGNGSLFTVFNVHINGVYHCSVRYRQFHSFHEQLKKEFGPSVLPQFPPKKILSLTPGQLEERRALLERYVQIVSQNQEILGCEIFNAFLLNAQKESQQTEAEDVNIDVYLMNGHKISVNVQSIDQTEDVLESVASQIELVDDFVFYFGLFLVKKEESGETSIVRKLQEFESPYISLQAARKNGTHRIVLRKSYWDPAYDEDLLDDRVAMNLLYVQAVNDIERGWVIASKDEHKQLNQLQQKGSKKEYLRLARTLKYYGYIQFQPCLTDYPQPGCSVVVSAGNKELNFRIRVAQNQIKEGSFKVTRMRCWRITTTLPEASETGHLKLELAFEYLIAREVLQWIIVTSDQAILMSMCLQGMVDELIMKKQGKKIKKPQDRIRKVSTGSKKTPMFRREISSNSLPSPTSPNVPENGSLQDPMKKIQEKVGSMNLKGGNRSSNNTTGLMENDAFDGIGDDDL